MRAAKSVGEIKSKSKGGKGHSQLNEFGGIQIKAVVSSGSQRPTKKSRTTKQAPVIPETAEASGGSGSGSGSGSEQTVLAEANEKSTTTVPRRSMRTRSLAPDAAVSEDAGKGKGALRSLRRLF